MPEQSITLLRMVSGVGDATIDNFRQAGYETLDDLRGAAREQLTAVPGVGDATADAILEFLDNPMLDDPVQSYRYEQKRKNIPPAGIAGQGRVEDRPATRYYYDPHLPPVLRFDDTGDVDQLPELLQAARRRQLTADEAKLLAEALRDHQPWLEWTGKREKRWFDVDPVALHIHERVSAEAIIAAAKRKPIQMSLFADPELEYREAIRFYEHDMDWTNRLILGDSLEVMHSLAKREDLAGKVQMIYLDPPYGIKFSSNFQPLVSNSNVKDRDQDLTREPEQIKAYRDTWTLGLHSYLAYLRDRLFVARDLLTDSGSIFVQIGEENVHRVRLVLDEVFGPANFASQIAFRTTTGKGSAGLDSTYDVVLWYAKNIELYKYHQLYEPRTPEEDYNLRYVELPSGFRRPMTTLERLDTDLLASGSRVFRPNPLTSQTPSESTTFDYEFEGQTFRVRRGGWKTNLSGMQKLDVANRLSASGKTLTYIRYLDDFAFKPINNIWDDTRGSGFGETKLYVVQTNSRVIEKCVLMTTDPGDLVLDPTCGSGTTAYVAEQWGRRWITVDTSRVAVALARQRLLTSRYDYYRLQIPSEGVSSGLAYELAPHIMLRTITNCEALNAVFSKWAPLLETKLKSLNETLSEVTLEVRTLLKRKLVAKERSDGKRAVSEADRRRWLLPDANWEHWQVPYDADPDWPVSLQRALLDYRTTWRAKMDEVDQTIRASAPQEVLVDRPEVVPGVVRVSGPFTVEGVQPAEEYLEVETPIDDELGELETFAQVDATAVDPVNSDAYLDKMIRLLRKDGVRFPNNRRVAFDRLEPVSGGILHAEGMWQTNGQPHRVVVSFGPQYGPVTAAQVDQALRAAYRRGYDDIVFAGFSFDGAAQASLQEDEAAGGNIRAHMAHIRPDVNMGDLLKDSPDSQLFTVFGLPRVALESVDDGEYVVHMEGVDVYDPVTNSLQATKATKVAAWFLDHDYNGQTFNISQAFFPDKSAWEKLAKALKSIVDPDRFAAFSSTTSLAFRPGKHCQAAVKVIDPRGNEVMKIIRLNDQAVHEATGEF